MILIDYAGHMVSDTNVDELHAFAHEKLGLHRWYFHNRRGRGHPHYDLTGPNKIASAVMAGALPVGTRVLVKRMARQ